MMLSKGSHLGPYEILAPLGAGGMGEVYKAHDTKLAREVAIKVLPESLATDREALARFEREARAVAALSHPNILGIFDFGSEAGMTYAAMELLEGETLRARLDSGPLPRRRTIEIAIQIAQGIAAAHEKGIIHRDLKPENIFLTADGRVKILDFGLARKLSSRPASSETSAPTEAPGTEPGTVMGTAGYMSPEQVRAREVDHRTDIFSFGAVLYEMLSGNRAFKGSSHVETMNAILKEEPPELLESGRNISPALDRLVRHCLEKNPEARFHSASDLAFDLEALTGSSSASAGPPLSIAAGSSRRRRSLLFASAGTAALLVVGIAAWFLGRGAGASSPPSYKQLTFQRGLIYSARFAPDDQSVYYSAAWNGQPVGLYSTSPSSPESRSLELNRSALFAVSPSQLAISIGCKDVFVGDCEGTLATVPISGGAPREVADHVVAADWMPGGREMAAVREAGGTFQVEFPLGKVIYKSATWINFLRVSPRGDTVAFAQYSIARADVGRVVILDGNGREIARSKESPSIEGLCWNPAGKEVWFAGTQPDKGWADAIYALSITGKEHLVFTLPRMLRLWDISKNGRILFSGEEWRTEMEFRGATGANEREFNWLDATDISDISSDGQNLAFMEWGEAAGPLPIAYIRNVNSSLAVKLGIGQAPVFSPDGKWVVAGAFHPDHLVLMPAGIGVAHALKPYGIRKFVSFGWMPGGDAVDFAGNDGQNWRMYMQKIGGGAPRAVTPSIEASDSQFGSPAHLVSPDGKFVFARDLAGKGWLYPVSGREPRPIPGLLPQDLWVNWTRDGHSAWVFQDEGIRAQVFRLDLSTGNRQLVATLAPADTAGLTEIPDLRITPDGKSYAYSYNRALSDLFIADGVK